MKKYLSKSTYKTKKIASSILKNFYKKKQHIIFLIEGPLGSGKTQFVKGVALWLKIKENYIKSPSFVYLNEIEQKNRIFYHIDFYRIRKKFVKTIFFDFLEEISQIKKKTVTCIEWANKIGLTEEKIKELSFEFNLIKVYIEISKGNKRIIYVEKK